MRTLEIAGAEGDLAGVAGEGVSRCALSQCCFSLNKSRHGVLGVVPLFNEDVSREQEDLCRPVFNL